MAQGIQEQVRALPAIKSECHFVQIGGEVLCADLVPASNDSPLEQRECGFDGIGCHASRVLIADVLFGHVVNGFGCGIPNGLLVGRQCVGNDNVHNGAHVFAAVNLVSSS